jgi:hypothetical protein
MWEGEQEPGHGSTTSSRPEGQAGCGGAGLVAPGVEGEAGSPVAAGPALRVWRKSPSALNSTETAEHSACFARVPHRRIAGRAGYWLWLCVVLVVVAVALG